jgi:hypothetical protein|tara:strand:+ start:49 stop:549 length:501 start_codon:yes stop_codon:yes gene_type:complete
MNQFFKEFENDIKLLSAMAIKRLYYNCNVNARNGGGGGKYKSALTKSGLTKSQVKEKIKPKKIDPRDILIVHFQELWVNQKGRCNDTNIELDESYLFTGNQSIKAPSIDRIDNSKGYIVGNLKIVMRGINKFRNNTPDNEFIEILKKVSQSVVGKYNLRKGDKILN